MNKITFSECTKSFEKPLLHVGIIAKFSNFLFVEDEEREDIQMKEIGRLSKSEAAIRRFYSK